MIGNLPEGVVLKSGNVEVSAKDLAAEVGSVQDAFKEQLKKNGVYLLEQMATGKLLLESAKKSAADKKIDVSKKSDEDILRDYFDVVVGGITVAKEEVKDFYDKNVALCGGTPFDKMKDELEKYVLQEKKKEAVMTHVRTLGQRMDVTVSAVWLKEQVPLIKDNPVDKARSSGKPALVGFGGKSCCGPDRMVPVMDSIEKKYKDKLALLYIEAKDYQILAGRYGVNTIPYQIFFDKDGKEIFRHKGLMSEEDVAAQLAAMGVK